MDPDQGGRLFRRLFPELRIQIRSADREILSRLPEILGGRKSFSIQDVWRCTNGSGRAPICLGTPSPSNSGTRVGAKSFPKDRERLETVLRTALAAAIDAVLGDDAVQWIELFLDRSEMLYPKPLELKLSEVPWLSQVHRDLKAQLKSTRDRWWESVLEGQGDGVDLRPFEFLRLVEALLEADQRLPHGHCVPRSLLTTELQFLREELPAAMLQTGEQRDVALARAPLVDLTVRLAKAHPELEVDALQAFVRDALELVPDPFAERRAELDYVTRYAIEASFLEERGLELPALAVAGRVRRHHPIVAASLRGRKSSRTKAALPTLGFVERFGFDDVDRGDRRDHHLRDPHPGFHHEGLGPKIDQRDFDFTAVIRIDGAGRVGHRNAMLEGQPRTRAHLSLVARRQGHGESAGNRGNGSRLKPNGRVHGRTEVKARRLGGGRLRKRGVRTQPGPSKFDRLVHGVEPIGGPIHRYANFDHRGRGLHRIPRRCGTQAARARSAWAG